MQLKNSLLHMTFAIAMTICTAGVSQENDALEKIQNKRCRPEELAKLLPIVRCSFQPSQYEMVLMTQLRNVTSSTKEFRALAGKIAEMLVAKVVQCLPTKTIEVQTPVSSCSGLALVGDVELVSVMRSGDILLDTFLSHFPEAHVSKFLIQRDEETAKPHFMYMKASPTLNSGNYVVITEPMIATGGTLELVISHLKAKGVQEEKIIVASVCAAPEGLLQLSEKFPHIQLVMTVLDERLNEKKYIVPGLGDFGDRFFGTTSAHSVASQDIARK